MQFLMPYHSLNWQHQLFKNPRPNPDIKTLFVDHSCAQPNGARAPSPAANPLLGPLPKAGGFPPLGAHGPFEPTAAPVPTPLAGWMSNPPTVAHPAVSGGAIGLGGPSMPAPLKHPRTPQTNPSLDYPSVDSDHVAKRTRPMGFSDECFGEGEKYVKNCVKAVFTLASKIAPTVVFVDEVDSMLGRRENPLAHEVTYKSKNSEAGIKQVRVCQQMLIWV